MSVATLLAVFAAPPPTPRFSTTPAPRPAHLCTAWRALARRSFFDPAGLSNGIDQATFDQYRTAELKHGRVAQLAVLGYIAPEIYRFPGDIAPGITFASIPNGVAAIDAIPALGWAQIIFLIGARARASRCVLAQPPAAPVLR